MYSEKKKKKKKVLIHSSLQRRRKISYILSYMEVLRLALKRLKKNGRTSAGFATYAGTQTVWRITPPA
jgi:hypothetical protein